MLYTQLPPEVACAALCEVGWQLRPDEVHVRERDARWLVELPQDQMAWFAASQEGLDRLHVERKVLVLLHSRCRFQVPRIVYEAPDGSFDVRAKVPGVCEPWSIYTRVQHDGRLAARHRPRCGRHLGGATHPHRWTGCRALAPASGHLATIFRLDP